MRKEAENRVTYPQMDGSRWGIGIEPNPGEGIERRRGGAGTELAMGFALITLFDRRVSETLINGDSVY